ncbi:hypothetical protein FOMPIDRAFT_1062929 [Fomitopsis schrenkii]|uniref:Uncharacterized protein n=1 Tax=Fomitopsis schrenkii TaxID=2126942 RepID=S8EZF5_FOMSC|nr:hypothetical protein FOMPIDRAFT_1062929 [Fomitopsis schrenkii]
MLQDIVAAHVRGASREAESLRELDMHVAATLPVQYRLTVAQCRRMPRTETANASATPQPSPGAEKHRNPRPTSGATASPRT